MTEAAAKPHWTHWVISSLLFLWNLLGTVNFLFQFDPSYVAGLPDEYQTMIADRPAWATIAFGVAVIGGAFGAILLMVRSSLAVTVFGIATIGAIAVVIGSGASGGAFMQIATTFVAAIYAKVSAGRVYPAQT